MKRPNIVFILIDALRARNVGCYGYPIDTTPNIDKIAEKSVLFENTFSCINATDPSITSIFSGMLPISHGLINHGSDVKKSEVQELKYVPWLPEILKKHGYATFAIDWLGRWHRRGFEYYGGFDRYAYSEERKGKKNQMKRYVKKIVKHFEYIIPLNFHKFLKKLFRRITGESKFSKEELESAEEITDKAIGIIKQNSEKNFFLFLHYWDVHFPYENKEITDVSTYNSLYDIRNAEKTLNNMRAKMELKFKIIDSMGGIESAIRKYDGCIRYVDGEIGRLIKYLKETGGIDNTILIITSDHGESLIDHGIFFDHHGLYDECIKVPLIIAHPSLQKCKNVSAMVQHTDILPTILDLLNINYKLPSFDGKSLIPLINGEYEKIRDFILIEEAYAQQKIGIRSINSKYIRNLNNDKKCRYCGVIHGGDRELYNLANDPFEVKNLLDSHSDIANYFDTLLMKKRRKIHSARIKLRLNKPISKKS